ncbi:TPA: PTS glucitol/sorbitol transporter subunit IIA [Clostridioides difficile]|nr:PTS glucitol/sorbitol transporter subunit IIA [Clostridioides difficile]
MKYEVKISGIGSLVEELMDESNCLIIYDETINDDDLKDISVIHSISTLKSDIEIGDTLTIGNRDYCIVSIGDIAQKTLREIGHCTIKFDGKCEVNLPGEIHVEIGSPNITIGDLITIS